MLPDCGAADKSNTSTLAQSIVPTTSTYVALSNVVETEKGILSVGFLALSREVVILQESST
jgi:hypothetical protein